VELADIVRAHGAAYQRTHPLRRTQCRALSAPPAGPSESARVLMLRLTGIDIGLLPELPQQALLRSSRSCGPYRWSGTPRYARLCALAEIGARDAARPST
jgi:hypothetical protein